ncbi:DNA topoisomerase 3 (plasmid) [Aerococcus urinaeequi]|uniref:DNA topoisomerase n=1 Tax=Aerococcus urinaeequi TaxID=51665 RepID=A0AAF0BKS5_9LACT|nr:type IA DNA topoisomerase [Aerococcus urinaeequi]WCG38776.1 DNA topoisomerase 3 [Aerococcus urinaeequi]
MMSKNIVVLAEKPSQAEAYAKSFEKNKRENGYYQVSGKGFDNTIITYGFGHLVELYDPEDYNNDWKNWQLDSLPIIPSNYQFKVSSDKQKQYKIVKRHLDNADEIVIATDSDREGEAIARLIIRLSGNDHKPQKRLWINSLEESEIQKGFQNLKDGQSFYSSFVEAESRQIADWLVGINLTRLYSIYMQNAGMQGVFSIGRVQTPTLYMIYQRNQEIEHFVKKTFYELIANFEHENGQYQGKYKKRFDSLEEIEAFQTANQLAQGMVGTIKNVNKEQKNTYAPKLFSLSDLQSEANRRFNMGANDTLKVVQSLYEKKYTSYPRSDSNYIGSPEFEYLVTNLENYLILAGKTIQEPNTTAQKRYVDSSKVQEHYAIIPTKTIPNLDNLNEKEKNIYMLILLRTLAIFEQPYQYEETTIITEAQTTEFKTTGKIEIEKGWKQIYQDDEDKNNTSEDTLPNVTANDMVIARFENKKGETKPPKYYTEGTLLTAMKNAGNKLDKENKEILKESEGIGTEATRASIIENLKHKQYISNKGKNILVTEKGNALCEIIGNDPIANAEMTAQWEKYLKKIQENTGTQDKFLTSIQKFIKYTIENIPKSFENNQKIEEHIHNLEADNLLGTCPECGGNVTDKGKFYGCSNYKAKDCKFSLPKTWSKKKLPKTALKDLLTKGETAEIKGFVSKNGNKFNAKLMLENGQLKFKFAEKEARK